MKIIYNNIIPFKGYCAMNICGLLFVRKNCQVSELMLRHETIHSEQIKEMGVIFFYIWYVLEWLIRLFINGFNAYYMISFEQEAYDNQKNENYLSNRKHYAWFKYLFDKK